MKSRAYWLLQTRKKYTACFRIRFWNTQVRWKM